MCQGGAPPLPIALIKENRETEKQSPFLPVAVVPKIDRDRSYPLRGSQEINWKIKNDSKTRIM